MTERLDDAPPRTWQSILAAVPEATPVGGLIAAPEAVATRTARRARKLTRNNKTSAELLATVEMEVSEPATREALSTMREHTSRRTSALLDDEMSDDSPDERPWLQKRLEGWWLALPMMAAAFMVLPFRGADYSLDFPVAVSATAALLGAARIIAVQSGRTKEESTSRGELILPVLLLIAAPIISGVRILLMNGVNDFGLITAVGIPIQILSAVVVVVVTARTPRRDAIADEDEDLNEDEENERNRYVALHEEAETEARSHLRAALAGRDPAVARGSRHTVVEAIRVLHEREQIDDDDAEWMLREALRATGPALADR